MRILTCNKKYELRLDCAPKKMLKLFIKRGKKAALLQTQAYSQILIYFAADNFKQFGRQNFSVVVID